MSGIGRRDAAAGETLRLPATRRAVATRTRLRTRRIPLVGYAAVLLVLPVMVILGSKATGWWVSDGHTVPATAVGADLIGTQPTGGGGEGSTRTVATATDVKGSTTAQQVLDAYPQITAAQLFAKFGLPGDTDRATQLKTLAAQGNGFEVSGLRDWLATMRPGG